MRKKMNGRVWVGVWGLLLAGVFSLFLAEGVSAATLTVPGGNPVSLNITEKVGRIACSEKAPIYQLTGVYFFAPDGSSPGRKIAGSEFPNGISNDKCDELKANFEQLLTTTGLWEGESGRFTGYISDYCDPRFTGTLTTAQQKECGTYTAECTSILGIDCDGAEGEGIMELLLLILTILTAGVGILATIGLVISGMQYTMARDDANKVAKVKSRIFNIVLGLLAYGIMWVALQWLIPGGIL